MTHLALENCLIVADWQPVSVACQGTRCCSSRKDFQLQHLLVSYWLRQLQPLRLMLDLGSDQHSWLGGEAACRAAVGKMSWQPVQHWDCPFSLPRQETSAVEEAEGD